MTPAAAPVQESAVSIALSAFTLRFRALYQSAATELPADTLPKLRKLLEGLLRAEHKALNNAPWSNLSAAIGYVAYQRGLSQELKSALHRLRVAANLVLHESYAGTTAEVQSGLGAVALLIKWLVGEEAFSEEMLRTNMAVSGGEAAVEESTEISTENLPESAAEIAIPAPAESGEIPVVPVIAVGIVCDLRVRLLAVDKVADVLLVDADPDGPPVPPSFRPRQPGPLRVRLPEAYADLKRWAGLRPTLRLVDCRTDGGVLLPRRVVLEPDYLISVTTVAECMQRDGPVPELALVNAFLPDEPARPLVVGNLVNALLDEEVREAAAGRSLDFDQWVRTRLFRQNPLQISALSDFNTPDGVQKLIADLRRQHLTLRAVRLAGFVPPVGTGGYQHKPLNPEHCFLEPAFLSARYGIQGRLDLLHETEHGYDLLELKSSVKLPPNEPWENHRAQAQLYRMLLENVGVTHGEAAEPSRGRASILYSNADPAAAIRPVGRDEVFADRLMVARNALVARELMLAACRTPAQVEQLLKPVLHPGQFKLPPFTAPKAEKVANAWAEADEVERAFGLELVRFAARELRVCLLGDDARPGDVGGQAGLWALPDVRKTQNFSLLDGLILLADHSADEDSPHLLFQRPATAAEVNFRSGDSLLLYPRTRRPAAGATPNGAVLNALDSQVVKVALEEITPDLVRLSVRNRRIAPEYLSRHATWALEPDCYDTFRREWAGVATFLGRPKAQRQLLLGRVGPRQPDDWTPATTPALDSDTVVERALAAPDWFLLCGPPGTGKTRKVLRTLAERLHQDGKNTLLAAYTNRAVDEICEQLVAAGLPFIRLGSRLSTEEIYRPYLLDAKLALCSRREDVRRVLQSCPIFVGTVSSLLGKPELFQFKIFDALVVDEASQILEAPMLALLGRVPKWILIGDHKQLPAVVTQDAESCAVAAPVAELLREELGLTSLRNSYFERLFRRAERFWPWAHGTLATQYRMHEDLTVLVNQPFYDGVLTSGDPTRQEAPFDRSDWPEPLPGPADLAHALHTQRRIFLPTRRSPEDLSAKESREEARLAARLAGDIAHGYGPLFDPEKTVGIIASFRNQVALIKKELALVAERLALPILNHITVDTVERYQGSQREVIIVSLCCHFEHQLETLVSLDESGQVDRKLNVALTRAREQLILLGNEEILQADPRYRTLLKTLTGAE